MNKLYFTPDLTYVLEAHGTDDSTLVEYASREVRDLWKIHHRRKKRAIWMEHNPIWLGIGAWEP